MATVRAGAAATVRYVSRTGSPTAATAKFYSPEGAELDDELVVTVPTTPSTTIATVVSRDRNPVASATGITPGLWVWWGPPSHDGAALRVVLVSGTTVQFETPIPGVAAAGDVIKWATVSAAIPAALIETVGLDYRIEWLLTIGGVVVADRQAVHVCLTPLPHVVDVSMAADALAGRWPDMPQAELVAEARRLATRASEMVEHRLIEHGAYPHTLVSRDSLRDAAIEAMDVVLYQDRDIVRAGMMVDDYRAKKMAALEQAIDRALSNRWVDKNDDGAKAAAEVRSLGTIRMVMR